MNDATTMRLRLAKQYGALSVDWEIEVEVHRAESGESLGPVVTAAPGSATGSADYLSHAMPEEAEASNTILFVREIRAPRVPPSALQIADMWKLIAPILRG